MNVIILIKRRKQILEILLNLIKKLFVSSGVDDLVQLAKFFVVSYMPNKMPP